MKRVIILIGAVIVLWFLYNVGKNNRSQVEKELVEIQELNKKRRQEKYIKRKKQDSLRKIEEANPPKYSYPTNSDGIPYGKMLWDGTKYIQVSDPNYDKVFNKVRIPDFSGGKTMDEVMEDAKDNMELLLNNPFEYHMKMRHLDSINKAKKASLAK